jgi:hypothetical protein
MINCKNCFHYKVCRYVRYEEFKSCKHYLHIHDVKNEILKAIKESKNEI